MWSNCVQMLLFCSFSPEKGLRYEQNDQMNHHLSLLDRLFHVKHKWKRALIRKLSTDQRDQRIIRQINRVIAKQLTPYPPREILDHVIKMGISIRMEGNLANWSQNIRYFVGEKEVKVRLIKDSGIWGVFQGDQLVCSLNPHNPNPPTHVLL